MGRGTNLFHALGNVPPSVATAPEQRGDQEQGPRHLPAAEVPGGGRPPGMAGKARPGARDNVGDLREHSGVDPGLGGGILEGEPGVQLAQGVLERLERRRQVRAALRQVLLPVPPPADELGVVPAGADQVAGDGQVHRRLAARLRGQPVVGVGGGVGQPGVQHDHLRAVLAGLGDPLRVRVEVVPGLQVRADQVDDLRVGVIGAGPVNAHPELEPGPAAAGAHVGVGVVAVDAPAGQHPLGVAVLAGAAQVHHDLVVASLLQGRADPRRDGVQGLIPGDPLPLALPGAPLGASGTGPGPGR